MNTSDAILNLYQQTKTFNQVSGIRTDTQSIDLAIKLIEEEVKELREAFTNKDAVEFIKEIMDVLVVSFGLVQKLDTMGFDCESAAYQVGENNLSKFPTVENQEVIDATIANNPDWTVHTNHNIQRVIFKNSAGKIMKPYGYTKLSLDQCVPSKLGGYFG